MFSAIASPAVSGSNFKTFTASGIASEVISFMEMFVTVQRMWTVLQICVFAHVQPLTCSFL